MVMGQSGSDCLAWAGGPQLAVGSSWISGFPSVPNPHSKLWGTRHRASDFGKRAILRNLPLCSDLTPVHIVCIA